MANFKLQTNNAVLTDGCYITNLCVEANNITATSNVTASYFIGDGSLLTGIAASANTDGLVSNTYLIDVYVSNNYFQDNNGGGGGGGGTVVIIDTTGGAANYNTNTVTKSDGAVVNLIFDEHPGMSNRTLANTFTITASADNLILDPEGTFLSAGDTITFTVTHSNLRLLSNGTYWYLMGDNTDLADPTMVGNTYAADTFSSNAYNRATFTSNAYNRATFTSNAYNTATYTSNTYVQVLVDDHVSALVNSAPTTLDTLNELAAALGDDPNFATTVTNTLATKAANSYVNSTFASNAYNTATYASNNYVISGIANLTVTDTIQDAQGNVRALERTAISSTPYVVSASSSGKYFSLGAGSANIDFYTANVSAGDIMTFYNNETSNAAFNFTGMANGVWIAGDTVDKTGGGLGNTLTFAAKGVVTVLCDTTSRLIFNGNIS